MLTSLARAALPLTGLVLAVACSGAPAPAPAPVAADAPPAPAWTEQTAFFAPSGQQVRLFGVGLYDITAGQVSCDGRIIMDASERRAIAEMVKALQAEQTREDGGLITRAVATVQRARLEKAWFDGKVAYALVSVPFDEAPPGWPEHTPEGGMYRVEVESTVRAVGPSLAVAAGECEADDDEPVSGCCP